MSEPVVIEESPAKKNFVSMSNKDVARVMLIGFLVAVMASLVFILLDKFVFSSVLCRPDSGGDCYQAPKYSAIIASAVSVIVGVIGLAKIRIYRPLLIALAVTISLWGIQNILIGSNWYVAIPLLAVISALAYALFAWFARIHHFVLSLVVTVVILVVIRYLLVM